MNNEIWLPITGYEGLYEVSNLGRVRSLERETPAGMRGGRVLRPTKRSDGYLHVALSKNGKENYYKVHRLVCAAFHENPLNLPHVNHKNEVKTDNRAINLEWCDAAYNNNYGTHNQQVADALSIPVFQYTISGAFVAWYPSVNEAARQIGVNCGGIANCANGRCKTQGGYQWSYEPALFLNSTDGALNNARSKSVYQYSLDGRFVKEWPSVNEIERKIGWRHENIAACARGKLKQTHGFRWFYTFQGLHIPVDDGQISTQCDAPELFD